MAIIIAELSTFGSDIMDQPVTLRVRGEIGSLGTLRVIGTTVRTDHRGTRWRAPWTNAMVTAETPAVAIRAIAQINRLLS
jgi:hypothetical protein